jgi:tungstate transport system substrate-binding protein
MLNRRTALLLACLVPTGAAAQPSSITVASTTSTEQSGLFAHLLPRFTAKTGIAVRIVAAGTGQALEIGRRGDADVVLVHDPAAEERFVAAGHGLRRVPVMSNDFVLVGPKADPAKIAGAGMSEALRRVAASKATFVSRGDRSGTHAAELRAWKAAGIDLEAARGAWYKEVGQGMGPTLNTAAALGGYALTDRGTWLAFKNRGELDILLAGEPSLLNPYGVIAINPSRHPHVKAAEAQAFIDWLISAEGQRAIADYRIEGEQLFFPNPVVGRS